MVMMMMMMMMTTIVRLMVAMCGVADIRMHLRGRMPHRPYACVSLDLPAAASFVAQPSRPSALISSAAMGDEEAGHFSSCHSVVDVRPSL